MIRIWFLMHFGSLSEWWVCALTAPLSWSSWSKYAFLVSPKLVPVINAPALPHVAVSQPFCVWSHYRLNHRDVHHWLVTCLNQSPWSCGPNSSTLSWPRVLWPSSFSESCRFSRVPLVLHHLARYDWRLHRDGAWHTTLNASWHTGCEFYPSASHASHNFAARPSPETPSFCSRSRRCQLIGVWRSTWLAEQIGTTLALDCRTQDLKACSWSCLIVSILCPIVLTKMSPRVGIHVANHRYNSVRAVMANCVSSFFSSWEDKVQLRTLCICLRDFSFNVVDHLCSAKQQSWCTVAWWQIQLVMLCIHLWELFNSFHFHFQKTFPS